LTFVFWRLLEESPILVGFFKNIDGNNGGTGGNLGWSEFQKAGIVQLEFTDLECHVTYGRIKVVAKKSQESFH